MQSKKRDMKVCWSSVRKRLGHRILPSEDKRYFGEHNEWLVGTTASTPADVMSKIASMLNYLYSKLTSKTCYKNCSKGFLCNEDPAKAPYSNLVIFDLIASQSKQPRYSRDIKTRKRVKVTRGLLGPKIVKKKLFVKFKRKPKIKRVPLFKKVKHYLGTWLYSFTWSCPHFANRMFAKQHEYN